MAHEVCWYIKPYVYYVRYFGSMSAGEAFDVAREMLKQLDLAHSPIHVIVDYTANPEIDLPFRKVLESEDARNIFQNPDIGWTVRIVDQQWHLYYFFTSVLKKYLQARTHIVHSLQEAEQFLREQDERL